jgi:hypothetical protein
MGAALDSLGERLPPLQDESPAFATEFAQSLQSAKL